MKTTEQGQRAILHHAGEVWNAYRRLMDAYAVDTGDLALNEIPEWDDLGPVYQKVFMLSIRPASKQITDLMVAVAVVRRMLP